MASCVSYNAVLRLQFYGREAVITNIVYASDDGFAPILGISMISLLETNRDCGEICIYILSDSISQQNCQKLESTALKYKREISFIDVSGIDVPDEIKSVRWSKSAFTRLYIDMLLGREIKKCLYLDCDTIVLKSLEGLYDTKLEGCILAAVGDCVSLGYRKNLGLASSDIYVNSGVLLIDTEKWSYNELLGFCEENIGVLRYPDQDVINGTYSKFIRQLSLENNCYTALFDFSYSDLIKFRKPSVYYSESDVNNALADPAIVHFTSSFLSLRPWVEGCQHPYADKWLEYKALSLWADEPLKKDGRSFKKKASLRIYKLLPSSMAVAVAGFLHSKVIPMLKRR